MSLSRVVDMARLAVARANRPGAHRHTMDKVQGGIARAAKRVECDKALKMHVHRRVARRKKG
jgi:hypothetical protein